MAREYKDSGIEWIGMIPKEWSVKKIKYWADLATQNSFIDGDWIESPDVSDCGIRYLTTGNIGDGIFKRQGNGYITIDTFYRLNCKYAYPKDLVISRLNAPYGRSCILPDDFPEYVLAVDIVILRSKESSRYICYATQCDGYHKAVEDDAKGTTMKRISRTNLGNIFIPHPHFSEQQRIADYLDKVCGEADEMIALQEKMIEELKVYKQSIITEAVTKGLNPNVPMKNSGIDWIGEVPEHWRLEPLKYCFGRRSEKNCPVKTKERLSLSIDKGVTLYSEKTTNLDRFKDDFTQYQIAYPNDIVLNCMNMIVGAVGLSNYMGCVSPVYYVIYPSKQDVNPLYYSYLLNIPTIRGVYYSLGKGIYAIERGEGRVNTCRLKVSYNDFGRLEIPVPPVEEQKAITQYIQEKYSEIDSLIAIKQQKIAELKEYKKSVIYEYVTGKKEVV